MFQQGRVGKRGDGKDWGRRTEDTGGEERCSEDRRSRSCRHWWAVANATGEDFREGWHGKSPRGWEKMRIRGKQFIVA